MIAAAPAHLIVEVKDSRMFDGSEVGGMASP
jgi:hypothetical protein